MGNLLRHGVHDGLRGHDGACNCSFGVDGLAGRIHHIAQVGQCIQGWDGRALTKNEADCLARQHRQGHDVYSASGPSRWATARAV